MNLLFFLLSFPTLGTKHHSKIKNEAAITTIVTMISYNTKCACKHTRTHASTCNHWCICNKRREIQMSTSKCDINNYNGPIQMSYIRIFNGRPEELYSDANFLTDAIELRSSSMTLMLAVGISLSIAVLTSLPASVFLTAMMTWTQRKARTRVVSRPRPLDAPGIK